LDTLDQTEVKRFALTGILVSMTCPALKNSYLKKKKKTLTFPGFPWPWEH